MPSHPATQRVAPLNTGPSIGPPAVALCARLPVPGKVKTRLAGALGDLLAAGIYRVCAEHAFCQALELPASVLKFVFFADTAEEQEIKRWVPHGFACLPQCEGDIGRRMAHAARTVFNSGASSCLIAGTDIPGLNCTILQTALEALDRCDVTVGPARDGGYYLIGMNRPHPELFTGIAWSTSSVFTSTLGAIVHAGLTVQILPRLLDLDTAEDVALWIRSPRAGPPHPLDVLLPSHGTQPHELLRVKGPETLRRDR